MGNRFGEGGWSVHIVSTGGGVEVGGVGAVSLAVAVAFPRHTLPPNPNLTLW